MEELIETCEKIEGVYNKTLKELKEVFCEEKPKREVFSEDEVIEGYKKLNEKLHFLN